jgi:hypothetical protein
MGLLVVPSAPPTSFTDSDAQTLINKYVGTAGWPSATNGNTVFSFVLNSATQSTNGGGTGCKDYDGYHSMTQDGVVFLINLQCQDPMTKMVSWDDLTITMSHEEAEAASDPQGTQNRGSSLLGGGEVGDICLNLSATLTSPAGDSYEVQRLYSSAVAAANMANPCIPDDGPTFFGATVLSSDAQHPARITVKRGGSTDFKVETFAMGTVGAIGFAFAGDFLPPTGLSFSPDYLRRLDPMGKVIGVAGHGWAGTYFPVTLSADASTMPGTYSLMLFSWIGKTRLDLFWASVVVQ